MTTPETNKETGRSAFPDTTLSLLRPWPDPDSAEGRARLNKLCSRYWRPVFVYIRTSWRTQIERAKDLTQEFFFHTLEKKLFSRFDPRRGRFRHFLKKTLKNFLLKDYRDGRRKKRGGGDALLPLRVEEMEIEGLLPEERGCSPEELFDRQWARDVIAQTLVRLRSRLCGEDKEEYFKVFEAYDLSSGGPQPTTYEEVARTMGLTVHEVTNYLHHGRACFEEIFLETLSDYVTSPDEAVQEMKDLFSA